MSIETMRTWKIGDVEITRIVEVNNWEDDIAMLLPDATPRTVLAYPWLQPHYATPQGKMIISFQCFVMRTREHRIIDRKSTRLNSSHSQISYAVFCLKKNQNASAQIVKRVYVIAGNKSSLHIRNIKNTIFLLQHATRITHFHDLGGRRLLVPLVSRLK